MSTPSLLNIPYLYKAGTLYSQIPESGAGDFTVTRATTPTAGRSTRINKNGLIELVADNVPRLDYPLGGAVNGCPALLVEPAATNLLSQSEAWNVSPWVATSGSQGATVSGNVTTSPDGTTNADKLIEAATTGNHFCLQSLTLTSGTTYTTSFFAKASERTLGRLRMLGSGAYWDIDFDLTLGTATGGTNPFIQNYGNGWYRIGGTFTANQASNNFILSLRDASGNTSYTGNGTNGFFVWGAQLETGSVATSYIPTTTGSVTRNADVISVTGVSGLIGQTEGTVYCEYIPVASGPAGASFPTNIITSARNINTNTGFSITHRQSDNRLQADFFIGNGTFSPITTLSGTVAFGNVVKVAFAYKTGDFALAINGNVVQTTSVAFTSVTTINTIELTNPTAYFGYAGTVRHRAAAIYPNRLTNAQLAALTAP